MNTSETKKKQSLSTSSIVQIGMLTAIIAVLSQISIPLPSGIPVTLQTFAIALTAYILGWKAGTLSTLIYVLLGTFGVPVFTGLKGGLPVLFGKTGGFIFGFIIMALLCGIAYQWKTKYFYTSLTLISFIGLILCHLVGVLQFSLLTHMGFVESTLLVSLPYLVKDIIFLILAYLAARYIRRSLNH